METTIKVDNLKCGGCAETISRKIRFLIGIEDVKVLPEAEEVHLTYNEKADLAEVRNKLAMLGYPEKGTLEGAKKAIANVKSYVSCAIGRLSGTEEQVDESHVQK